MPSEDTTYWCSIHERPAFSVQNYIVGFSPNLTTPEALAHTHHFNGLQCQAPVGEDPEAFFGKFVGEGGKNCSGWNSDLPYQHCRMLLYVWAVGGKPMIFPEHVGYAMEHSDTKSYVMMEIHYNNPESLPGIEFDVGVDILHTTKKRQYDAELLNLGHSIVPSHIIPPNSTEYTTVGHCAASCTSERIPADGINTFNVLLHSHLSGRRLKIRQFRDGKELPWIANDDNYVFDYQQNRNLRNEAKILPGDQLAYECVTDNTWNGGQATIAGLSTKAEMCEAFIWYYPKTDFRQCQSMYGDLEKIFSIFDIQNVTYEFDYFDPTVTAPDHLSGKRFSTVLNEFQWTQALKEELQAELRYSNHASMCSGTIWEESDAEQPDVAYPAIENVYVPPNPCSTDPPNSANTKSISALLCLLSSLLIFSSASKLWL